MKRAVSITLAVLLMLASIVAAAPQLRAADPPSPTPSRGTPPTVAPQSGAASVTTVVPPGRGTPPTVAPNPGSTNADPTPGRGAPPVVTPPAPACTASQTVTTAAGTDLAPTGAKNEVATLRGRSSRVYDMGDGNYKQVLTTGSVNYQDARGNWQPIDNTLVAATKAGYAWQNKANDYSLSLPIDLSGSPVSVTRGGASVSFALVGAQGTGTICGASATYANALPGVSVAYRTGTDAVEETLTLASAAAPHTFTFTMQLSAGLTARANATGGIDFIDGAGKVQLAFAPPSMSDSATPKPARSQAVTFQLSGNTVTMTADAKWLADPARVFPVVIDPSVITYTGTPNDCWIGTDSYAINMCPPGYSLNDLTNESGQTHRALMQMDLSQVPINAQIKDAEFDMYLNFTDSASAHTVSLNRLTRWWWVNAVSWHTADGTTPWTTDGGDFDGLNAVSATVGPYYNQYYSWHPTQMVRGWMNGSIPNYGMILGIQDTDPVEFRFNTSYASDPNVHPKLTITYPILDSELGARSFYTLAGGKIDDRLAIAVNPVSGNLLATSTDLTLKGTGIDLTVGRAYNSLMDAKGAYGNRWTMSTGADIRLRILASGNAVYQGGTGYQTTFTKSGGSFTSPPGADSDLTFDGTTYTLTFHANRLRYLFNTSGQRTFTKDQNNNTIAYTYNGDGTLGSIKDTQERTVTFSYTGGLVTGMSDTSGGRSWQYNYTSGNLTSVVEPVSSGVTRTTSFSYDSYNNLTQITDPRGGVTTFHYPTPDTYSVVDTVTRVYTGDASKNAVTSFAYSTGSTVVTDANGHTTTIAFDTNTDLVTQVTDANGHTRSFTYTSSPDTLKIKTETDAYSHTTTYDYNADNLRVAAVHLPTGATTTYAYDTTFIYYLASVTDAQLHTVSYTYDANGNRLTETNQLSSQNQVQYFYNSGNGTIDHVIDARGNTIRYGYTYAPSSPHVLTQLVVTPPTVTSGTQLGATTTNYDNVGRTYSVMDGKSQTTTLTYDYLDRMTNITYAGGASIGYTIDGDGNTTQRVDNTGTTGFTFDPFNRMTQKTIPASLGGGTLTYAYDKIGNLTSYTDSGGAVAYHYNSVNLLDILTEPSGAQTTFGYDNNNQHTSTTYPSSTGVVLNLVYDTAQRLVHIYALKNPGPSQVVLSDFTYTYTYTVGGVTHDSALRQSVVDGVLLTTTTYGYDVVNRLTSAHAVATGTSTQKSDYQYVYDGSGNRTQETRGGIATNLSSYNEVNEQTVWNTGSASARGYSYDGDGNETGSTVGGSPLESRTYNAKNQTISAKGAFNTSAVTMGYADAGQGERTSAGSSTYTNSSLGVSSEQIGAATTYYTRTPSGHLVSQRTSGGTYYYLFDGLGSVVALVNASGVVQARYAYDPYGQTVAKVGPDANPSAVAVADGNPWRYTGAYLDATGLYKLGERYYDPSRGRFTQLDPLGSGYIYASDNPVNFIDPSGLESQDPSTEGPGNDPEGGFPEPEGEPRGGNTNGNPWADDGDGPPRNMPGLNNDGMPFDTQNMDWYRDASVTDADGNTISGINYGQGQGNDGRFYEVYQTAPGSNTYVVTADGTFAFKTTIDPGRLPPFLNG